MPKRHYKVEEIIHKLREADVLLAQGMAVAEVCRTLGVPDVTYYRWCKEYGKLKVEQAKRTKELEQENTLPRREVSGITDQGIAVKDDAVLYQALAERDEQIASLNRALAERDEQIARQNAQLKTISDWASEINNHPLKHAFKKTVLGVARGTLHAMPVQRATKQQLRNLWFSAIRILRRSTQGIAVKDDIVLYQALVASLNRALAERDKQIASLNRALAEHDEQIARQSSQRMTISDWASEINNHPLKPAFKKKVLGVARGTLHAMPVQRATKQQLRNFWFSAIRLLRRSTQRKSDPGLIFDQATEAMAHGRELTNIRGVGRDIFVFAIIDWHFRIQRPQHIAHGLAERGHRVFYFSNHFINSNEPGYELEKLPGADALFQVKLHVKDAPAIYFDAPTDQVCERLSRSIAKLIHDLKATSSISLIQHPYWYPLVKRLPNTYRVYDCMDYHEGFGNVPAKLVEIEKELLGSADLITVSSSWLADFAHKHSTNVALIRNAVEYDHFSTPPRQVFKDSKGRKVIGYYGAIAEWFDIELVRCVAQEYQDCLLLLVGNDTAKACKKLCDLPNIELTGEVPYSQLPFYLYAFDVCILPFKQTTLTLATNPVKVYEYLAAGKPVISVDLPEVAQFNGLVFRAHSKNDFIKLVGFGLQESAATKESNSIKRRRFASEQTWNHRATQLSEAISTIRMPKVSVIVLTYNNLELTRACINSVLSRSDYPNLEIIVVDNASSDDTPAYLEDLAHRHSNVRPVLNRENLGFAAGNNIGLSIATGDYLILLNNDTVVTQGWILTLLRHFQNNPKLGLLGPVTNNIGNEARIETSYRDIADMPAEALRYTLAHMGECFPIKNTAFFCVMLSRSTYELCGPISEDYGLGFFEDDDYCRKVELLGLTIACAEDVFVHHHLSASFNKLSDSNRQALFEQNKLIYEKKWGPWEPHVYRR